MQITMSWTAYGQHGTDSVVITRDQQRNCLKCLMNSSIKDSIIISNINHIADLDAFIDDADRTIIDINSEFKKSISDLESMKKKRKRAFLWGGLGATIIETLIIIPFIK